jgi:5-methylcytosine-specific restriction protein A
MVSRGRCTKHQQASQATDRRYRGTASDRGYDWRWARYSKRYLRAHPLCRMGEQQGRVEAAELVDHIIPVKSAGDPGFYEESNLQPLCRKCHAIKTAEDIRKGLTR